MIFSVKKEECKTVSVYFLQLCKIVLIGMDRNKKVTIDMGRQ